jgi:hypothetical protein
MIGGLRVSKAGIGRQSAAVMSDRAALRKRRIRHGDNAARQRRLRVGVEASGPRRRGFVNLRGRTVSRSINTV